LTHGFPYGMVFFPPYMSPFALGLFPHSSPSSKPFSTLRVPALGALLCGHCWVALY